MPTAYTAVITFGVSTATAAPISGTGAGTVGSAITGLTFGAVVPSSATAYASVKINGTEQLPRVAYSNTSGQPPITPVTSGSATVSTYAASTGGTALATSGSFTVSGVTAALNVVSYTGSVENGQYQNISGVYTGSAPTTITALWDGSLSATVVGYTAANGIFTAAVLINASAGSHTLTITGTGANTGSDTTGTITVVAAVSDLPAGLNFPSTIVLGQQANTGNQSANWVYLASASPRGFAGIPAFTVGGAAAAYFACVNGAIHAFDTIAGSATTSFNFTLTGDDGIGAPVTTSVTCLNPNSPAPTITTTKSVVLDSGTEYTTGRIAIGATSRWGTVTTVAITDPANKIKWDSSANCYYIDTANKTAYGTYPVTELINGTYSYSKTFYIAHDRAPQLIYTPAAKIYTSRQPGALLGTVRRYSVLGVYYDSIASDPASLLEFWSTGEVHLTNSPTAGTLSATLNVSNGYALSSNLILRIPVATGTVLSAFNMTAAINPSLVNYIPPSTPATAATLSVTGMTPTSWAIDVTNSLIQSLTSAVSGTQPNPRYTISGSGASVTILIHHAGAMPNENRDAWVDNVVFTADDGAGTVCVKTGSISIAWATPDPTACPGGIVTVGSGKMFATGKLLQAAIAANPAWYAGAKVYDSRLSYNGSNDWNYDVGTTGTFAGYFYCPLDIWGGGGAPTVRSEADWHSTAGSASNNFGICSNGFDLIIRNMAIRNVSNHDNAGGIGSVGQTAGNIGVINCMLYDCNDGIRVGNYGQVIYVKDTLVEGGGTGQISRSHNLYVEQGGNLIANNLVSWNSCVGHLLKNRSQKTDLTNCLFIEGVNGTTSALNDLCQGGTTNITNAIYQKNASPDNDGNGVQWASEPESVQPFGNGDLVGIFPHSNLTVTGGKVLNLLLTGQISSSFAAFVTRSALASVANTPVTGVVGGVQYFNTPSLQRLTTENIQAAEFPGYPNSTAATDGGSNSTITTYPMQQIIDPLTGVAPTILPNQSFTDFGSPAGSQEGIYAGPLVLQLTCTTADALNTSLTDGNGNNVTFRAIDNTGADLTSTTWSIYVGSPNVNVTSGGVVRTGTGLAAGLLDIGIQCIGTGINSAGASGSMTLQRRCTVIVTTGVISGPNLSMTSPTWDTSTPKYGTGALSGGGGTAVLALPLGSYTIRGWFKAASPPAAFDDRCILTFNDPNSGMGIAATSGVLKIGNTSGLTWTGTVGVCDGTWHFVEASMAVGGTSQVSVDGVADPGSFGSPPVAVNLSSATPTIHLCTPGVFGQMPAGNFQGYGELDDVMILSIAAHSSNFTPPAAAQTAITGTVGLWGLNSNGNSAY